MFCSKMSVLPANYRTSSVLPNFDVCHVTQTHRPQTIVTWVRRRCSSRAYLAYSYISEKQAKIFHITHHRQGGSSPGLSLRL